jgi:signal transduction histidine kinase
VKRAIVERLKTWVFSLRGKFIIVASVCIFVFALIGSFSILSREEKLYKLDTANQCRVLAEISRVTLTNVLVFNELGMMDKRDLVDYLDYFIMNLMERDKRIKYALVLDNEGGVLADNNIVEAGRPYGDEALRRAVSDLQGTEIVEAGFDGEEILKITTSLNIGSKRWGVLQLGLSMAEVHRSIHTLKKEIAALALLFAVLSFAIVGFGAKILARPVTRLSRTMDGITTHGDLDRLDLDYRERRDEIGALQNSFLWMVQRLRDADQEHKKTAEVLSQTEKMVSIGRLASGVAHEINNPLGGVILCFRNLIEADADASRAGKAKREKLIEAINDGLQKMKNIVGQLLDFSRMTVTEKAPVDLNELLNRMLVLTRYHAAKKRIEVVSELSADLPKVMLDKNKMTQVFMNIILNALHAMDGGGTLTIRTKFDGGSCVVSFEDTGCGIPPGILPNIFDPFFTTKGIGEGTGLGLSVSKGIVEQHGGTLEAESAVGAGSTFRIRLPREGYGA